MSGTFATLAREIHRTWLLTSRIPASAWHHRQAARHDQLAQWHRDRLLANSTRALELAARYPSKIHPRGRA